MANRVDVVSTIVQLLTSPDSKIKDMVVQMFAVICVVSTEVTLSSSLLSFSLFFFLPF